MRAIVLLRSPLDLKVGMQKLNELRSDRAFVVQSRSIIESVQYAYGAAHFVVVLYALTTEQVFQGIDRIREALAATPPVDPATARATSSTILGWDSAEDGQLQRIIVQASEIGIQRAQNRLLNPQCNIDDIIGWATVREYVVERLNAVRELIRSVQVPLPSGEGGADRTQEEFLESLEAYLTSVQRSPYEKGG